MAFDSTVKYWSAAPTIRCILKLRHLPPLTFLPLDFLFGFVVFFFFLCFSILGLATSLLSGLSVGTRTLAPNEKLHMRWSSCPPSTEPIGVKRDLHARGRVSFFWAKLEWIFGELFYWTLVTVRPHAHLLMSLPIKSEGVRVEHGHQALKMTCLFYDMHSWSLCFFFFCIFVFCYDLFVCWSKVGSEFWLDVC